MIVITGANGFIGRNLVKALIADKAQVRALDLSFNDDYPNADLVQRVKCDIRDASAMSQAIKPGDTVVHLAARVASPSASENQSINVEGTRVVCDACTSASARLMFMSAAAAKFVNANAYGASKKQAEEIVANMRGERIVMRTPLVVGPGGEEYERFAEYVRKLPGVIPVFGSGTATKQPIHIDDVVSAISRLMKMREWEYQILEVACRERVTFNDLIDFECEAAGLKKWKLHLPLGLSMLLAGVAESILGDKSPITRDIVAGINEPVDFDVDPALALLNLVPGSAEEAFKKAADSS